MITALLLGIALSATCGFRIFVPLLGLSVAHHLGFPAFGPGCAWIGTTPATIAFGVAAVLEIAAYYIPWVDNLLDTIATPLAVCAGVVVTAAVVADMDPLLRWTLATVAGGGSAGLVQGSTVALRATSSATTGGLGNPVVATVELVASIVGTVTAILVPVLAVTLLLITVVVVIVIARRVRRRLLGVSAASTGPASR